MDKLLEQYANIPPLQRYLLAALLAGGLIAGYYYLFYGDTQIEIDRLTQEYTQKQTQRLEKEGVRDNLPKYQDKLSLLQQQLDAARAKLPDTSDVPQLLAQLGNRARQVGLNIDEFKPGGDTAKGFYSEIAFEIRTLGSYHEIAMFIDAVGRLDRIVNVSDLVMEQPKSQNSKVVVVSHFKLKTFRFIDAPAKKG